MRHLLLLSPLVLAACSSGGAGHTRVTSTVPVTTQVISGAGEYRVDGSVESREITQIVNVTPAQAWSALPEVYRELGLNGEVLDDEARFFGTRGQTASRRLGGVRLATYVDCGGGSGGLPIANTYRVHLSVGTRVEPVGERAQLRSAVLAQASPQTVSGPSVRCSTTGHLEARIAELLAAAVASPEG